MSYETLSLGLTLKVPRPGTKNWAKTYLDEFAKKISEHDHTGSGKGNQIVAAALASNSVTTAKIVDANVTTAKIADANVTTQKIADGAITTAKLGSGAVLHGNIGTGEVQAIHILDGNVTTAKLADNAVTTAKILDANVTTAKIADGNITLAKLAANSVNDSKIVDASISQGKIGNSPGYQFNPTIDASTSPFVSVSYSQNTFWVLGPFVLACFKATGTIKASPPSSFCTFRMPIDPVHFGSDIYYPVACVGCETHGAVRDVYLVSSATPGQGALVVFSANGFPANQAGFYMSFITMFAAR